ncbi:type IV pili sensor histidine kinase and response regulator,chpA; chemosensory pili system protein ChpA (sensor histidine kinase/response regulator) [Methylophilaceae bacterium]|nr:type IV pili sensor histidine kinase and response regulator,chpA; chemosensory pili system protein ChpA (sensor histidine kinase/response regulator) [Methylophilaceae bacterium]
MAEDFDIGPLTWVKDEIEQALNTVLENLESFAANPGDTSVLRFSQTHLYQVSGALDMVGLLGCKRFCLEIEKIESRLEKKTLESSPEIIDALRRAIHLLQTYLNDLLEGAPDVPLRLFPALSQLAAFQGETVTETELFFPDTSIRAPRDIPSEPIEEASVPGYVAEQRMNFQKSLLKWLKTSAEDSLDAMRTALDNVQKIQQQAAQKTLWWVSGAFIETLSQKEAAENAAVKRLCRQIDQQLRNLGDAGNKSTGTLLRDQLYYIARSTLATDRISRIRELFELKSLLPDTGSAAASDDEVSAEDAGRLAQIAEIAPDLRSLWSRISEAGNADNAQELLPEFAARLSDMMNLAGGLSRSGLAELLEAMHAVANRMSEDASALSEAAFVEVAASFNTIGDLLEQGKALDGRSAQAMASHKQRLQDILEGRATAEAVSGKLDSTVLLAVAQQIKDALREVEQALDTYFRNPAEAAVLATIKKPLGQVIAAFEMLEMPVQAKITALSSGLVEKFNRVAGQGAGQDEFELVAESLSMLGFFVDELPRIRPETTAALDAALSRLEQHETGKPSPQPVGATVPAKASEAPVADQSIDPELLGIFVTEAEEVLAAVAQSMQALHVNPTDHEALVIVRRGYHTLKGSARTVGLADLGEIAWIVEKMLNTVMENKVVPSPAQLMFVDKVSAALASRVAELKDAASGYVETSYSEWQLEAEELEGEVAGQKPAAAAEEVLIGGTRKMSRALFNIFTGEAGQHLETLKAEAAKVTKESLGKPAAALIRSAHTLASNAGATGFKAISDLARSLENWLDVHPEKWDDKSITLLNNVINKLAEMLEKVREKTEPKRATGLLGALKKAMESAGTAAPSAAEEAETKPAAPLATVVPITPEIETPATGSDAFVVTTLVDQELLTIFMEEARELVPQIGNELRTWRKNPQDTAHADTLQRALHTLKGSARMAGQAAMGDTVHEMEDRIIHALKNKVSAADFDQMFEGLDRISALLEELTGDTSGGRSGVAKDKAAPVRAANRRAHFLRLRADVLDRLINEAGEISIARSRMEREMQAFKHFSLDLTESVFRLRNYLRELEIETESQMQSRMTLLQEAQEAFDPLEFDRFTRLQELTRMMAESVNDVSTIQHGLLMNLDETESALQQQSRMNRELQYGLMDVRMVPFSQISERLHRIVRQTARELKKSVELVIEGESLEIDRSVLDKIGAPLEHLLRNAVGHGMETPAERKKRGKPEIGSIKLRVKRENEEITLTVEDDGAGIDLEKVREKAIRNGLILPDQETSEQGLLAVIFEPGFSTATDITQISGRGVGLDAVRGDITGLGGRIEVVNAPEQGAVFSIYLPVTLSVAQVVLIRTGTHLYALPSIMVEQLQKLKPDALAEVYAAQALTWAGRQYPVHFFAKLIGEAELEPEQQVYSPVLLLRSGSNRIALHVDEIIGNQEIVMKPIGPQLARVPGITGATVLGDGKIILIVNPIQMASREVIAVSQVKMVAIETAPVAVKPVVMVVDDSLTMRKVLGRTLEREGYHVITAKDGMDALQVLQETRPDIMLLDIEMPRMDGFELARNVRGDPATAGIPIIIISSRTAEKHRSHAQELGVNAFLGKPVQDDELLMEIQMQLAGSAISA